MPQEVQRARKFTSSFTSSYRPEAVQVRRLLSQVYDYWEQKRPPEKAHRRQTIRLSRARMQLSLLPQIAASQPWKFPKA